MHILLLLHYLSWSSLDTKLKGINFEKLEGTYFCIYIYLGRTARVNLWVNCKWSGHFNSLLIQQQNTK